MTRATWRGSGMVRNTLGMTTSRTLLAAAIIIALIAGIAWSTTTQAANPSLQITAPRQGVVGEPISIVLTMQNANDVAAYEAALRIDRAVANLRSVDHSANDLSALGRDVRGIGPVETPDGYAFGAYSCAVLNCADAIGDQQQTQGGRGTVHLVTFTVVAEHEGPLTIDLGTPVFANVDGQPLQVDLGQTSFSVEIVGR